jgi:hypothetical protein
MRLPMPARVQILGGDSTADSPRFPLYMTAGAGYAAYRFVKARFDVKIQKQSGLTRGVDRP